MNARASLLERSRVSAFVWVIFQITKPPDDQAPCDSDSYRIGQDAMISFICSVRIRLRRAVIMLFSACRLVELYMINI